ncbi:MAG: CPBP family intramembrane glutamic endopeptidase [Gemmatimonadaceae bacterium]
MRHELRRFAVFAALTIAASWLYWLVVLASARGLIAHQVPLTPFGSFGPALAAVATALLFGGRRDLILLFRRLLPRGVTWVGLAIALLGWPALVGAAIAISSLAGVPLTTGHFPLRVVPAAFAEVFIFTALGEELGWRGYALPALLTAVRPVTASVLIGALWAIWHLPLWWLPGTAQAGIPFGYFALSIVAYSFIYTGVFLLTKPSIIVVMLLHTTADVSLAIAQVAWPRATAGATFWFAYFGLVLLIGVAVAVALRGQPWARSAPSATLSASGMMGNTGSG